MHLHHMTGLLHNQKEATIIMNLGVGSLAVAKENEAGEVCYAAVCVASCSEEPGSKCMYMWSAASAVTDSVFQMHQSLASYQWVVSLIILWLEYRQCAHVDAKTLC